MQVRISALVVTVVLAAGCGTSSPPTARADEAGYLLIARNVMTDSLRLPDTELVARGRTACTDLDSGMRSDAVVAHLSSDALPGSAEFNADAALTAAAARTLCPQHAASFAGDPETDPEADPNP